MNSILSGLIVCTLGCLNINAATISYPIDSTSDFPNPERGLFCQTNWDYQNFSIARMQKARLDSNITVIRVYYRLDNYYATDILPKTFLDKVLGDGEILRKSGAKMVPRFIYNGSTDHCNEPPLPRMLSHINQLAPVIRANLDVIAYLETGFIGMYGEWHHFDCNPSDPHGLDNTENRRKVLFRILDSIPGAMVALRYNFHKRPIFNTEIPLSPDSAFSGSHRARTGATNDAFASRADNMGTYQPTTPAQIESQKAYLALDNRYVPQGGEAEQPFDTIIAGCDSAKADLKRMHWDILGYSFDPRMHALWQKGGCREEIRRKLGYRISLLNATLQDSVRPGNVFSGTLRLINSGYGKIYNARGCELVFRNIATQEKHAVKLALDPRRWCMTDSMVTLALNVTLPANIPNGKYKVYLNLPDTAARLYGKKEYSIRLANANTWEDSTGYNSLLHTVSISPTASIFNQGNGQKHPLFGNMNITKQAEGVRLTLNSSTSKPIVLEIFSVSGLKIWKQTLNPTSTGKHSVIARNIPAGIHFLKTSLQQTEKTGQQPAIEMRRFFN
jgi:Domain of unknown function (DUF4832)/Domain of unknown function (DUF4874)